MRQEWREYWSETISRSWSVLWVLPVTLLLFLVDLISLEKHEVLPQFIVRLVYGVAISLSIWLAYAAFWAIMTARRIRTGRRFEEGFAIHFVLGLGGMTAGMIIGALFKAWYIGGMPSFESFSRSLMVGAFITLMFLFYYFFKYSNEENLQLRASSEEARYHVLKNQMQPHFLFNSLNGLAELITSDPASAAELSQKLADLYREILENSKAKTATLSSELSIVRKYLELEQIRYGERLKFALPREAPVIYIPSLVLQTLVENAVKHGISKNLEGGSIEVAVRSDERTGWHELGVSNDGSLAGPAGARPGTGIANTRQRLDLLYGPAHAFTLANAGGKTRASFLVSGVEYR